MSRMLVISRKALWERRQRLGVPRTRACVLRPTGHRSRDIPCWAINVCTGGKQRPGAMRWASVFS
ncbi:MAG TPA: hypothetical protein VE057_24215 [Archangium sp.]|nr:hypothetical protein [Archangium sp.]